MSISGLPYLSVVIAARNDNYGGDFDTRLNQSLNWYCLHFEKLSISAEIVIVDYNPIAGDTSLLERIKIMAPHKNISIRIITVPAEVHALYNNADIRMPLPFYEFPAKNIGIRRAKGQYILSTNADVILHPSHFGFIARQKLKAEKFYRVDRADFLGFEDAAPTDPNFLQRCRRQTFKYFARGFKYNFPQKLPFGISLFGLKVFNTLRVNYELFKANNASLMNRLGIGYNPHNAEFRYHTHNSGDFMLMHRDSWVRLKGNPENTYISTHADALFVVTAGASGLKEHVFCQPAFHREHERRFSWKAIENDDLYYKQYLLFEEKALKMIADKKVISDNSKNWGAGDVSLPEITI